MSINFDLLSSQQDLSRAESVLATAPSFNAFTVSSSTTMSWMDLRMSLQLKAQKEASSTLVGSSIRKVVRPSPATRLGPDVSDSQATKLTNSPKQKPALKHQGTGIPPKLIPPLDDTAPTEVETPVSAEKENLSEALKVQDQQAELRKAKIAKLKKLRALKAKKAKAEKERKERAKLAEDKSSEADMEADSGDQEPVPTAAQNEPSTTKQNEADEKEKAAERAKKDAEIAKKREQLELLKAKKEKIRKERQAEKSKEKQKVETAEESEEPPPLPSDPPPSPAADPKTQQAKDEPTKESTTEPETTTPETPVESKQVKEENRPTEPPPTIEEEEIKKGEEEVEGQPPTEVVVTKTPAKSEESVSKKKSKKKKKRSPKNKKTSPARPSTPPPGIPPSDSQPPVPPFSSISKKLTLSGLEDYDNAVALMSSSKFAKDLSSVIEHPAALKELFTIISTPEESELLAGVTDDAVVKKVMFVFVQLLLDKEDISKAAASIWAYNLLRYLFSLLDSRPPLNELRAHYLRSIVNLLLKNYNFRVFGFLRSEDSDGLPFALKLFEHLDNDNIATLTIELMNGEIHAKAALGRRRAELQAEEGMPEIPEESSNPYWTKDVGDLVELLYKKLSTWAAATPEEELTEERARQNCWLIVSAIIQRSSTHPHLLVRVMDMAKQFFDCALSTQAASPDFKPPDKFSAVSLTRGLGAFADLVRIIDRNLRPGETYDPESAKSRLLFGVIDMVKSQLASLKVMLDMPPSSSFSFNAHKEFSFDMPAGKGPYGIVRFEIVKFLCAIINTKNHEVYWDQIKKLELMKTVVNHFFLWHHNNFLHQTVTTQLIRPILLGDKKEVIKHLLEDCSLLEKVMAHYQPSTDERLSTYHSYNGHLTEIAQLIQSKELCKSESWLTFVKTKLEPQVVLQTKSDT